MPRSTPDLIQELRDTAAQFSLESSTYPPLSSPRVALEGDVELLREAADRLQTLRRILENTLSGRL